MSATLLALTSQNLTDTLRDVFEHDDHTMALVIYDLDSSLSTLLTDAYRKALPNAMFINFHEMDKENILSHIEELEAGDFVALVQSRSFRLSDFRIRIELFKKHIKVAEHPHLARMSEENEVKNYINALAYDKAYYHHMGHTLKAMIEKASGAVICSGDEKLIYPSCFEDAKLNIGDYREMKNVGGQFPIGEVFTELKELTALNGRTKIMAFGDINYKVNIPEHPITIIIENGKLVATENSTADFEAILNLIKEEEGLVWVRELGLGLNRALSKENFVSDMGTFERMCGIHLSLGAKHGIYAKEGMKRNSGKFHIDVMLDTNEFRIDEQLVFDGKQWML
jgi:leucyl aminopeptidase (aminopeptidase T)